MSPSTRCVCPLQVFLNSKFNQNSRYIYLPSEEFRFCCLCVCGCVCVYVCVCVNFCSFFTTGHSLIIHYTEQTNPNVELSWISLWNFITKSRQGSVHFCEKLLSACHTFTVRRFIQLSYKPTNQPLYQSNTTNHSRNTKCRTTSNS